MHPLSGGLVGDSEPSWAPRGGRIAFVRARKGTSQIFVTNPGGRLVTQLTSGPAPSAQPSWSPDGSKIVFDRWIAKRIEVWVMNANGSGGHRVVVACDDTYSTDPTSSCALTRADPAWQPGT